MEQQTQNTLEIGRKLVDLCKQGENSKAITSLYAQDVETEEAFSSAEMPGHTRGIDIAKKKNDEWNETMEVHSSQIEGPFPLGDRFAVRFKYDATDKKTGKRSTMDEVAVYTVRDGKIVKEEFFYTM